NMRLVQRRHPKVTHPIERRQICKMLAVGAHADAGVIGVSEKKPPRHQIGLQSRSGAPEAEQWQQRAACGGVAKENATRDWGYDHAPSVATFSEAPLALRSM